MFCREERGGREGEKEKRGKREREKRGGKEGYFSHNFFIILILYFIPIIKLDIKKWSWK